MAKKITYSWDLKDFLSLKWFQKIQPQTKSETIDLSLKINAIPFIIGLAVVIMFKYFINRKK